MDETFRDLEREAATDPAAKVELEARRARLEGARRIDVDDLEVDDERHGSFSWRARHRATGEAYLLFEFPHAEGDMPEARLRHSVEVRRRHVHALVPQVHAAGVRPSDRSHSGEGYYVCEPALAGAAATQLPEAGRGFAWRVVLGWAQGLTEALVAAHDAGIVHGRIEPQHVRVADGRAVGLAGWSWADRTRPPALTANPGPEGMRLHYVDPEALSAGREAGLEPSSDVYALCATLFTLISGRRPYYGETYSRLAQAITSERVPDLRSHDSDVPAALANALRWGMGPRESRPSAARLLEAWDALAAGRPAPAALAQAAPFPLEEPPPAASPSAPGVLRRLVFRITGKLGP